MAGLRDEKRPSAAGRGRTRAAAEKIKMAEGKTDGRLVCHGGALR